MDFAVFSAILYPFKTLPSDFTNKAEIINYGQSGKSGEFNTEICIKRTRRGFQNYTAPISFAMHVTRKHKTIPVTVGIANASAVHFTLCVSFLIVMHVVPHGQCMSENSITHTAVTHVQPWHMKSECKLERLLYSVSIPVAE